MIMMLIMIIIYDYDYDANYEYSDYDPNSIFTLTMKIMLIKKCFTIFYTILLTRTM